MASYADTNKVATTTTDPRSRAATTIVAPGDQGLTRADEPNGLSQKASAATRPARLHSYMYKISTQDTTHANKLHLYIPCMYMHMYMHMCTCVCPHSFIHPN